MVSARVCALTAIYAGLTPAPRVNEPDQPRARNHHAIRFRRCQSRRVIIPRGPCPVAQRLIAGPAHAASGGQRQDHHP